jgi:type II secretory pathway pseudopilin PulG
MRLRVTESSFPWKRLAAEFGVIVAGVLIALAVDSWWERQQEQKQAEEYLQQLLIDFQQTQRRLQGTIAGDTQTLERVNSVLSRAFAGPFPPADSLELPTGYNYFEPLAGTLTALVEGGDLRLIRNDSIRFELIAFSALIETTETVLRHTETMIWHSTEQLTLGRARHSQSAARRAANGGRGWERIDVAGALNDPGIISALQVQAVASQIRLFNLRRLEEPTARIIGRLEAELGSRDL